MFRGSSSCAKHYCNAVDNDDDHDDDNGNLLLLGETVELGLKRIIVPGTFKMTEKLS